MSSLKILLRFSLVFFFHCSLSSARSPFTSSFIKASCNHARYPQVCCDTLSPYASTIRISHKVLLRTSLNATMLTAESTVTTMNMKTKRGKVGLQSVGASEDCIELLQDSIYQLQNSIDRLDGDNRDINLFISDISTWVSAALTDLTTCTDELTTMDSNSVSNADFMGRLNHLTKMTSNCLALIVHCATGYA